MINTYIDGFVAKAYHTENGGTVIDEQILGRDNLRLALIGYGYLAAATAHVMSVMHPGGTRTGASAAAAKDQKELICVAAPKDPAGNAVASGDIIAYKLDDSSWEFNVVDSLATKTITMTTNLSRAVLKGSPIRIFGIVADGAVFNFALAANVTTEKHGSIYMVSPFTGDPLYVSIDNATNAGKLNNLLFAYINK
jgi:hypothetical protein